MGVASGETAPDAGTIVLDGEPVGRLTPAVAQALGLAIVHQHPALLPDLTVAENIRVAVRPEHLRRRDSNRRGDALAARPRPLRRSARRPRGGRSASPSGICSSSPRRSRLQPRLLILDEPTAPLGAGLGRAALRRGAQARRRDARGHLHLAPALRGPPDRGPGDRPARRTVSGTAPVDEISDDELLALIVGRAARVDLPAEAAVRNDRRRCCVSTACPGAASTTSRSPRARARSSGSPGSSGTARVSSSRARRPRPVERRGDVVARA